MTGQRIQVHYEEPIGLAEYEEAETVKAFILRAKEKENNTVNLIIPPQTRCDGEKSRPAVAFTKGHHGGWDYREVPDEFYKVLNGEMETNVEDLFDRFSVTPVEMSKLYFVNLSQVGALDGLLGNVDIYMLTLLEENRKATPEEMGISGQLT